MENKKNVEVKKVEVKEEVKVSLGSVGKIIYIGIRDNIDNKEILKEIREVRGENWKNYINCMRRLKESKLIESNEGKKKFKELYDFFEKELNIKSNCFFERI